eukprot:scaffold269654_cov37-Prasinocladus_malaysianus.AAC.1
MNAIATAAYPLKLRSSVENRMADYTVGLTTVAARAEAGQGYFKFSKTRGFQSTRRVQYLFRPDTLIPLTGQP